MGTPEHTDTAMHNSIVHTEIGFRGVPVSFAVFAAATNPLQCLQARPHSRRLTHNSGVGLRWPRFQKPGFRKHRSNLILTSMHRLPLSPSFYFHFSLYPSQPLESASCPPQSWWLSLLHSVCHSISSSEVDMLCFRSACSFGCSLSTRLADASSTTFARDTQYFCVRLSTATYWNYMSNVLPSIGHSFHSHSGICDVVVREGENSIWPVAGRVRGMVVGQRSYKQKTLSVTGNMVV